MRICFAALVGLVSLCLIALDSGAQDPGAGPLFFHLRQFKIPFRNDQRGIVHVRLWVSSDQGRHWQHADTAAPEDQHLRFTTPTDGYYWFAIQTVDTQGKLFPEKAEDLRANLRVIVDATPPVVQVQPLPARPNQVGVAWTIRDDNLDLNLPDSTRVEYRPVGGVNWIPIAVPPGATQVYWNPQAQGNLEVRVLARDRAGNVGEDKTNVGLGGAAVNPPPFQNPIGGSDPFKDLERTFVSNKQISLRYDLNDVGPSGVSTVELWYILHQGRTWTKLNDYAIDYKAGFEAPQSKKLTFEVNDEGIYGISLVAKSGVGLGARPPQVGERPQFWIEVDVTKPVVHLNDVKVGAGFDKGKLTIDWKATDKNLGPMPIRLSYAEDKTGQWQAIADKLLNNGRYVWKMPEALPYQFYVRVEAIDRAGNVGEAITVERVKVDLSLPKAKILDVTPGGQ